MKFEFSEAERTPTGDNELEQVTRESDAEVDKNHEHVSVSKCVYETSFSEANLRMVRRQEPKRSQCGKASTLER